MKKKKVGLVILVLAVAASFTVLFTGEVLAADKIGKLPDCTEGQIAKVDVNGEWTCSNDIDTDTLAELNCAEGEIPKKNASLEWDCADDETDSSGNGTMSTPIMWSGGCSTNVDDSVDEDGKYCTDQEEFNTAQDYLSVDPDGTITVKEPGFYRINAFAQTYPPAGQFGTAELHVYDGTSVTVPYYSRTPSDGVIITQYVDVTLPLDVDYTFEVRFAVQTTPPGRYHYFAWTPSSTRSRLQVIYQGPLPTP